MDYNIERKIRLIEKNKDDGLYGWCLNEIDESGKSSGDEIPWAWSFNFMASSLRLIRSVDLKSEFLDNDKQVERVSKSASIRADLHSGTCIDGESLQDKVNFEMFGTKRSIQKFDLSIFPVNSNDEEFCSIWGCPSYDTEIDFSHDTTDDVLVINLGINKDKFDEFATLVESKKVDFAGVRIGGVSGFYSHWSPSIRTSYIKVLTDYHDVEGAEQSEINILRTGSVRDFSISLNTINNLNIKPNIEPIEFEKIFHASEIEEDSRHLNMLGFQQAKINESFNQNEQVNFYSKLISGIKTPLWLIFVVLCLILIAK